MTIQRTQSGPVSEHPTQSNKTSEKLAPPAVSNRATAEMQPWWAAS